MKQGAINQALFLVIIAVLLSSGCCSLFRALGLAPPIFRENFSLLDPEDFPEKIKQLEEISQNHKSMAVRTRALFYLALAHIHYINPSPDYSKALNYLDKYIALESDNKDIDEIVAWKSILRRLDSSLREYEKLERSYAQLKQEYKSENKNREFLNKKINDLGQIIEKQKKEIGSLQETIKKLDAVQQEIEKKKKGIKKYYYPPPLNDCSAPAFSHPQSEFFNLKSLWRPTPTHCTTCEVKIRGNSYFIGRDKIGARRPIHQARQKTKCLLFKQDHQVPQFSPNPASLLNAALYIREPLPAQKV
jgi:tetratricopeptide (TPR) repeat protein